MYNDILCKLLHSQIQIDKPNFFSQKFTLNSDTTSGTNGIWQQQLSLKNLIKKSGESK